MEKIRVGSIRNNFNNNSPSFRAEFPISPQDEKMMGVIGEHVVDALRRDLPKIKESCEDSYRFRAFRVYGVHPAMNSQNVISHWRDEIKIEASKKTGVLSREFGPSVVVESCVNFLDAAKKSKELLDDLIAKKKRQVQELLNK